MAEPAACPLQLGRKVREAQAARPGAAAQGGTRTPHNLQLAQQWRGASSYRPQKTSRQRGAQNTTGGPVPPASCWARRRHEAVLRHG